MKAMGYAKKVVTEISTYNDTGVSGLISGIQYKTSEGGTSNDNKVSLYDLKVERADNDGSGNNINNTYAKKNDPEATVIFRKLKLKNPYTLSSSTLDNNDVLCAFDVSDGELSKTNLKVKDLDGLITDLSIGNGVYSFYKYDSSGNKVYTHGVLDDATYVHYLEIYKFESTRLYLTIVNKSSSRISLQQLASYTSSGARIMCTGYVDTHAITGIKYAGMNSVYAIATYKDKEFTYIIDSSYTIGDVVKSI